MSNKRSKRTQQKNNKKASKNRRILRLKFHNGVELPAKTTYMKDTEHIQINDIDINKIRVSDKKLYNKTHNSYKYYVFYEPDDEYIPMRIILKDMVGYYNDYKDNSKYDAKYSAKRMNFRANDDSLDKVYDVFEHIEEKLEIGLNNYIYMKVKMESILKQLYLMKHAT